jgi:hypothetical protein
MAGFTPELPGRRTDAPKLTVASARAMSMTVDRSLLRTVLAQAGRANVTVPAAIDGATLSIDTPPAITARYGRCPEPEPATVQSQIANRPPPTTDHSDCIVLLERPVATAQAPAGLDMTQLISIALEVAGMSPDQTGAFQTSFDSPAALTLTLPRFMRSYDVVQVGGAPAMRLTFGGRRGPTYQLIWTRNSRVYSLTGYGSPADALPLAQSIR